MATLYQSALDLSCQRVDDIAGQRTLCAAFEGGVDLSGLLRPPANCHWPRHCRPAGRGSGPDYLVAIRALEGDRRVANAPRRRANGQTRTRLC
jgi:hypothetical protein